jgi:hypothetical protein
MPELAILPTGVPVLRSGRNRWIWLSYVPVEDCVTDDADYAPLGTFLI